MEKDQGAGGSQLFPFHFQVLRRLWVIQKQTNTELRQEAESFLIIHVDFLWKLSLSSSPLEGLWVTGMTSSGKFQMMDEKSLTKGQEHTWRHREDKKIYENVRSGICGVGLRRMWPRIFCSVNPNASPTRA